MLWSQAMAGDMNDQGSPGPIYGEYALEHFVRCQESPRSTDLRI